MGKQSGKALAIMVAVMMLSVTVFELNAHARAGGSRSFGSRGSSNYSRQASPSPQQSQTRQQATPAPNPSPQQQSGGGFMRNMAGGIMGGMLGSMLFSSFAGANGGMGGMGGGGFGLFEMLLLAGGGYFLFRYISRRRTQATAGASGQNSYNREILTPIGGGRQSETQLQPRVETGLSHIRQMDSSFDESQFCDSAMDHFFKVQSAWMNRDLGPVSNLLTEEMGRILQAGLDQLRRDKQINKLENIAVRKVDAVEAWQDMGMDYITTSIYANLLDYTTDEVTGLIISGSKTEPVKFQEYWTFTRPVGNNPWKLSAIQQQ